MCDTDAWRQKILDLVIHTPIAEDVRTLPGTYLGWPKGSIFRDVIKGGQANFDAVMDTLSGEDKALLYAKYNQPGHIIELDIALTQLLRDANRIHQPYVFDIGCGPFTAGLSLAHVLGKNRIFHYYGIDLYTSMRTLAKRLADAAKEFNGLNSATTCSFYSSIDEIPTPTAARSNAKIFIASYLLSSNTLDVSELATDISYIADNFSRGPSFLLYTNSTAPFAQRNFPEFKKALTEKDFMCTTHKTSTLTISCKSRSLSYALFYKPAVHRDK